MQLKARDCQPACCRARVSVLHMTTTKWKINSLPQDQGLAGLPMVELATTVHHPDAKSGFYQQIMDCSYL